MARQLVIAHSPDSDDAYMMAPLALGWLEEDTDSRRFGFEFVRRDIETLNQEASGARYDVTAISFGAYPEIEGKYDLLRAGSSMQEGTGPLVVARKRARPEELAEGTVAIPGLRTSAYLAMRLWMPGLRVEVVPFDKIMGEVAEGRFCAGLLIHEGQLMYEGAGLHLVVDLGGWWKERHNLPLPMGGNAIRKDLPPDEKRAFARLMKKSVEEAMSRHHESIDYAMGFGRGMDRGMVDRYVRAWVNAFTIDVGEKGAKAVGALLSRTVEWVDL